MNTTMIKPMLTELLEQRGITLYRLAKDTDLAYSTLHNFSKARTESIDFRVLDLICDVLECQPGDLLVRVPNGQRGTRIQPERAARKKGARAK
jgi:putative transcriptional regulator